jgi:RPA family protein
MTAVKLRIQDLVEGTFDGKAVHTLFGDVSEARIVGTLIDIFVTDDESYTSLTVDDGTETIRLKAWRNDVKKLKKFSKGDIIDVVGKVREYNEEIYLTPALISKVSPNKWVLWELELMKLYIKSGGARDSVSVEDGETPEPVHTGEVEGPKEKEREKEPKPKEIKEAEEVDFEEIEEFEILGEDEVTDTVLDLLKEGMTKDALIEQSGLDEIDVELALRELLDEKKIKKEDNIYTKA